MTRCTYTLNRSLLKYISDFVIAIRPLLRTGFARDQSQNSLRSCLDGQLNVGHFQQEARNALFFKASESDGLFFRVVWNLILTIIKLTFNMLVFQHCSVSV